MTFLAILIAALAVAGIVGTVLIVLRDGYRPIPTRPLTETASGADDRRRRTRTTEAASAAETRDLPHREAPLGRTRREPDCPLPVVAR